MYTLVLVGPLDTGSFGNSDAIEKAFELAKKHWKMDISKKMNPISWELWENKPEGKKLASGKFTDWNSIVHNCYHAIIAPNG